VIANECHEIGESCRADKTVVDFVAQLDKKDIPYAIARNYENYPSFGHDLDLFVRCQDVEFFIDISVELASKHGWDYVTQCDWDIWWHKDHSVKQIRFYNDSDFNYLQIDLIHFFPLYGLPLIAANELLLDREVDVQGRFYKISKSKENFIRVFQIYSLLGSKSNAAKIARYSKRLESYIENHGNSGLLNEGVKLGVGDGIWKAICLYNNSSIEEFKKGMLRLKLKLLVIKLFKNPFKSLYLMLKRISFYIRTIIIPIHGCYIRIFLGETDKNTALLILQTLKEKDYITSWKVRSNNNFYFNRKERKTMEKGGILVQWAEKPSAKCIDLSKSTENKDASEILKQHIIFRHSVIYNNDED